MIDGAAIRCPHEIQQTWSLSSPARGTRGRLGAGADPTVEQQLLCFYVTMEKHQRPTAPVAHIKPGSPQELYTVLPISDIMNWLLVCHVLFAVFCLIGAALTAPADEECKTLLTPLSLADHSVMEGAGNLLLGYTNNAVFNDMLEVTQKSEINMTVNDDMVTMDEVMKINGTCYKMKVNMKIEGDKSMTTVVNFTSVFELLPACEGCWVISGNTSAKNLNQLFQFMKLNIHADDEINASAIYFYAKDSSAVKDEDRERFRKQASCLGFAGDANFQYNPDKAFCKEDEMIDMPM